MAFQSVPNTAEIVITYTGHSQEFKNILYATKPGGYLLADLTLLASTVDVAVAANWLPLQGLDYLYVNTVVRGLNAVNDQEVSDATSSAFGAGGAAAMPDNVTLSVKKTSGLTGRAARGRLYWIGTIAGNIATNENQYNAAAVTNIVAAIEAVRVAIAATVWDATLVSRWLDGVLRPTGATFSWIGNTAVNNNVDSQRRRLIN